MIDPRWRTVLAVAPYLVLGMLVAFALGMQWSDPRHLIPELVLCAGYAVLVLVLRDLPTPWRGRSAAISLLMPCLILINLALVLYQGWFAFLTISTFSIAYSLVPWPWELVAVGATAVVAGLAQASGFSDNAAGTIGRLLVVALNIVAMCGLSWGLRLSQKQLEVTATEAERARLAREIHDTLAQGFAGIVTQLQAAEHAADDTARDRHTDAALSLARDGLAEARRSVQALRPAALDTAGLPEAIRETARRWSRRTGIPVDVRTTGAARPLAVDAEVALLRTAQKALANVERHADAHSVALTLAHDQRGVRLEVRDDGRGFDAEPRLGGAAGADAAAADAPPTADQGGGYGLIAMRERITALAGELIVDSHPGRGTSIRAEVPR
ncbi:hypothetical protein ASE16_00925 [Leifsonia sp. Root227]|uniref:sensor histidine kinase n=1 Tax=Leifsonia sp. Root227 TaxID=1736496 RepID=UPI0006F32C27|nr:sensor histidine kinase [Leifsonia sp. Root227]KRC51684.1 hypothetical protein ASE16_00925 [Leifsonia sp. Root227]